MPNGEHIPPEILTEKIKNTYAAWLARTYSKDTIKYLLRQPDVYSLENEYFNYFWTNIYNEPPKPELGPFDIWVRETYSPEFAGHLPTLPVKQQQKYYDYYYRYVEPKRERLPAGRPRPEKYGLTENDWLTLEMVGGSEQGVMRELDTWLSTGYIKQHQARDILDELKVRLLQAETEHLYGTEEYWAKWHKEQRRQEETVEALQEMGPPAGVGGRAEAVERGKERRELARAWQYEPPRPRYEPALEEMRAELEGPQPWQRWFESQFPSMTARFKAQQPKFEARYWPGMRPKEVEEEIEAKTWPEYLKKAKPEKREEWYGLTPYQRGERPSVYAPRIQTVKR